jgi:hypothetical protein
LSAPAAAPARTRSSRAVGRPRSTVSSRSGKGFCRTPHFFHRALPRYCNDTQNIICGLILDRTVGCNRKWAPIQLEAFAEAACVSTAYVEIALARLESAEMDWVESQPGKRKGAREYRLKLIKAHNSKDCTFAECGFCHTKGVMDTDRGFCRTPRSYFRKLPACVPYPVWLVVGVILDETVGWRQDRARLSLEDFTRDIGLVRSTVQKALVEAKKLGLIDEQEFEGCASEYWVYPERFDALPRLSARQVSQPAGRHKCEPREQGEGRGEDTAEVGDGNPTQLTDGIGRTRPSELVAKSILRCRNCQAVGPWKEVSSDVGAVVLPIPSPPGPKAPVVTRGSPPATSKTSQKTEIAPVSEELSAWLRGLSFRKLPDLAVTREIAAALGPVPVRSLQLECSERIGYLRGAAHPYKVIVKIAGDLAGAWRAAQPAVQRDEERSRRIETERHAADLELARRELAHAETDADRDLIFTAWPELREEVASAAH